MKISNEAANAHASNVCALLNNGYLRFYSGSVPANADASIAGNTLLAELRFGATAFGAPSAGVATANAMTADSSADNTGTASFARAFKSDGSSPVCDFTVSAGGGGGDIILDNTAIQAGVQVSVTSLTYTASKG